TGTLLATVEGDSVAVDSVVFSADGRMAASVGGFNYHSISLWDIKTAKLRATFAGLYAAALSPDGKLLASAGLDGAIKVWDSTTGNLRATLQGHTGLVRSIAFGPDGKLLVSGSDDNTIKLWDIPAPNKVDK